MIFVSKVVNISYLQVVKSAELVGYFVQPVVWVTMVTGTVKATQSYASLQVLAAIIRGSERQALQPHLVTICNTIVIDEVCRTTEVRSSYSFF